MGETVPCLKSDKPDHTIACIHCDKGGDVYERTGNGYSHAGNPEDRYYCGKCGNSANEVNERERYAKPGIPDSPNEAPTRGFAKKLWDADPEDLGLSPIGSANPGGPES